MNLYKLLTFISGPKEFWEEFELPINAKQLQNKHGTQIIPLPVQIETYPAALVTKVKHGWKYISAPFAQSRKIIY